MAVVMMFEWEGFTPEYHDELREKVGWDDDPPEGNQFHVAWFEDDAVHVVDVWDSEPHFERFFNDRLKAALPRDMKVRGAPRYKFRKVHGKTNPEARKANRQA